MCTADDKKQLGNILKTKTASYKETDKFTEALIDTLINARNKQPPGVYTIGYRDSKESPISNIQITIDLHRQAAQHFIECIEMYDNA